MSLCRCVFLLVLGSFLVTDARAEIVSSTYEHYPSDVKTPTPPQPAPYTTTTASPWTTTEDSGDFSVEAKGSLQWKETIQVHKRKKAHEEKKRESQRQVEHHTSFIPKCCNAPSNKSQEKDFMSRRQDCQARVKSVLGREASSKVATKNDLEIMNCFLQCTSRKAGLSDENGVIRTEEMVDYTAADIKMAELGITKEMIKACIITSKGNSENVKTSSEGRDVCNMANHEHMRFVKCMLRMENMRCPQKYYVKSSACEKYRDNMRR